MSGSAVECLTTLPGVSLCRPPAEWPGPPVLYSYSSLKEAEACPRQWALRRGRYPHVWDRSGYPGRPHPKAVAGTIVHKTIEDAIALLVKAECDSFGDPRAVSVLVKAGGWSQIIRRAAEQVLSRDAANPRLAGDWERIARSINAAIPEYRTRVQAFVGRLKLFARATKGVPGNEQVPGGAHRAEAPSRRGALACGTYSEVQVVVPKIKCTGNIDLLTIGTGENDIAIDDFKTGVRKDEHAFQLQLYSLLWYRDGVLNPMQRRASRLRVRYDAEDVDVTPLSDAEMGAFEEEVNTRISIAVNELSVVEPEARPDREQCSFCEVRHLCSRYWCQTVQDELGKESAPAFAPIDLQLRVLARRGGMLWDARVEVARGVLPGTAVLVRASGTNKCLDCAAASGLAVRVLGAVLAPTSSDEDRVGPRIVTLREGSEVFILPEDSGRPLVMGEGL